MNSVLVVRSSEYPGNCKNLPQINGSASDAKRVKAEVKVPVRVG